MSRELLRDWMKKPGFPKCRKTAGSYVFPISEINIWRNSQGLKGTPEAANSAKLKQAIDVEKLKQARIETDAKMMKLGRMQGRLLPRQSAELVLSTLLTKLGDDLDQIANSLPGTSGVPVPYHEKLRDRCVELLDEFRHNTKAAIDEALTKLQQQEEEKTT